MSRLIFLGAAKMQLPPIKYARAKGHYVITVDYRPENPGHQLADESYDLSTTDVEGVLELAREKAIDGVVAYASDPAAPTAAYVGRHLGLPSNSYGAVDTLADKEKFRHFLCEHGFNVPKSQTFTVSDAAQEFAEQISGAVFVKPADSSGSKGVSRITERTEFSQAFEYAKRFSRSNRVVVEEEIPRDGYQVAGDGFVVDGRLEFFFWANEHFDYRCNGLVPIGESFPSVIDDVKREVTRSETQRLLDLLGFDRGALNFDFVFTPSGELYFLELGPRNGGNLIPEVTKYATGVDMIACTVDTALGKSCQGLRMAQPNGFWSSYIIHADRDGVFNGLELSSQIRSKVVESDLWVTEGDRVSWFRGSHDSLGTMILNFESQSEMLELMDDMGRHVSVIVE